MGTSIPVWGAAFTLVLMIAGLSSPAVGVLVDWLARHRQRGAKAS